MKHLSTLLPSVLPFTPFCPPILAVAMLKASAIEFCERTRCWRAIQSAVVPTQGHALAVQEGAMVHLIEEATLNGKPLEPVQFTHAEPDEITGITAVGLPRYITQIEPGKLQIYPFEAGGTLRVSAFLKPRADAKFNHIPTDPLFDGYAYVPDFLVTQDAEAVAQGAIYRIKMMPAQPSYDPDGAGIAKLRFDTACDGRFSAPITGQQRAKVRTKPHWI